jgi:hypothetical protein
MLRRWRSWGKRTMGPGRGGWRRPLAVACALVVGSVPVGVQAAHTAARARPHPVAAAGVGRGTGTAGGLAPRPAPWGPFLRGMTDAAYAATVFASAASDAQLRAMAAAGVNAVSIQTAWYQETPTATVIRPTSQTPSDASLVHIIRLAHSLHMRVFLDPFVNAIEGNAWQGAFHPVSWSAWFRSYDRMIVHYAILAQQTGVNLLAIGDENDTSDHDPALLPDYLRLIALARRYYHGPLVYGADYPDFQDIPPVFWRALNAIGLEGYFPLADSTDPTQAQLDAAWAREVQRIAAWRRSAGLTDEPVILTEIGYYSADTTAENPGAWEPRAPLDLRLQEECYRAVFTTIYQQPWLDGIFWFWWANPSDGPDWPPLPTNNGYNVQNKPVLALISSYYRAPGGGRPPA